MLPFIHITNTLYIPTYILIISLTYCICLIWAERRANAQNRSRNMTLDIALAIMIGGFLGARLFHILYENPEIYMAEPQRIFKFWEGGFVFYGGFFGALVAAATFLKWRQESFLEWADFYAPVLSFGYAFGRLGCFLNGCCYGRLCDLPWAVEFNFPGLPIGARHPTQLYAIGLELIILFIVLRLEKKRRTQSGALTKAAGTLFYIWLALHSAARLVMEYFRDDFRGPAFGLSVSSWISIALLVTSTGALTYCLKFSQSRRLKGHP